MSTKHQSHEDHETLCGEHSKFTDTVCDAVIALQDSAFELGRLRGIEQAKAEQAKQPKATGWIATAKQMPEAQTRILVCSDQGHIDVDQWWGPDYRFCYPYWSPLPLPEAAQQNAMQNKADTQTADLFEGVKP